MAVKDTVSEILSTNFVNGKHLLLHASPLYLSYIVSISREANSPFIVDFVLVVARIVLD